MELDPFVVAVGDKIHVSWPLIDGTFKDMMGVVKDLKKSKKSKFNSMNKYFIQFDGDEEVYETRLIHLQYKIRKHDKRKRVLDDQQSGVSGSSGKSSKASQCDELNHVPLPTVELTENSYKYIVAPMVGASELAFRLLCRRYGATLAYTPMISSEKFAVDAAYRAEEFQCTPEDRPVVAHFSANNPQTFLAAAKHVEKHCDAIGEFECQ